jgi:putative esterase/starch binding protein with CBM20 domain
MRKILASSISIVVIIFAASSVWIMVTAHNSQADSDKYVNWALAQKEVPVHFAVTVPPQTPKDQTLYISGDASVLGNWDAAGVPMERNPDGTYTATVQLMSGIEHAFKVTRGTWGTVERGPNNSEIPDHLFTARDETTVSSNVTTWVDNGKSIPGRVTLTGDIRLHKKFHSNLLGDERTLIVYLPPNYEQSPEARFPVLYMHDGQNIFDASTSFAGVEWRVDENAQEMILDGRIKPVIVVGIYNTPDRTDQFIGSKHDLYGRFIVEEVKPYIDRQYRTLPDPTHTAMAGSAMGGLATMYIAQKHSDIFGAIALFDPFLRDPTSGSGGKLLINDLLDHPAWATGLHWYVNMASDPAGVYPGTDPAADGQALHQALLAAGLKEGSGVTYEPAPGEQCNETGWSQRIDKLLSNLYGRSAAVQ